MRRRRTLYAFLLVPVLFLMALIGFPIVYNLMMSVQEVNIGNLADLVRPFVGLDNYVQVLSDPAFFKVIRNSLIFVTANMVAQIGLGLLAAMFFAQRFPGAHFMRGILLSPWILPALVVGALWKWIFATEYGLANHVLMGLSLISRRVNWLSDPSVSLLSVTIANVWFGMPFSMILIAAGLAGIPQEQYEAASLDGAGALARFLFITWPALRPTLLAVACLVVIYTMRAFDLIFTLTGGGPLDSSNVIPLLSYQLSFQQFQFGLGSAVGTFAFLIVFVVALIYVRTLGREANL